jgi:hypothetical protein
MTGARWLMEFVPSSAEFRVHMVNHKVIRVVVKRRRPECGTEPTVPIRSNAQYSFQHVHDGALPKLEDAALLALGALSLDAGAADVLRRLEDGKYVVLEVNTAPGLEGHSLAAWVAGIQEWAGETATERRG